jgi:hypothetical protein
MGGINCSIKNYGQVVKALGKIQQQAEKDLQGAIRDVRREATKKIADEVAQNYNVKKSEITAGKIVRSKVTAKAGSIEIKYTGRLLTPTHFKGYSPKKPSALTEKSVVIPGQGISFKGKPGQFATVRIRKPYKVKAEIKKGNKITFSQGTFVAPAAKGSQTYIPFQRSGESRKAVEALKTLSVPQMVTNDEVAKNILEHLSGSVSKGLDRRAAKW